MSDNPWAWASPSGAGIVAYFWSPPPDLLFAAGPGDSRTKILWISHAPPGRLSIVAHPLGATSPVVHFEFGAADAPAGNYPSSLDLPNSGCWQLDLSLATAHATIDLMVAHSPTPSASTQAFRVTGPEAVAIATVERFIEALNAGNLEAAIALVTDDAGGSDCDFVHHTVTLFNGKPSFRQWLAARIADHERLTLASIFNANPEIGPVLGVDFSNRSNDTLARLGSPKGVVISGDVKVVVTPDMAQIRGFVLGPFGADPGVILNACSP